MNRIQLFNEETEWSGILNMRIQVVNAAVSHFHGFLIISSSVYEGNPWNFQIFIGNVEKLSNSVH